MPRYSHWTEFETQDEFDQIMEKEYQERLNRYEEYVQKYQPTDVVKQYINNMLKADYYKALFYNLNQFAYNRNQKIDIHQYTDKLKDAALLLANQTII